ncbi:MAG: hypothetical protein JSU63_18250 [Phycisphaerales bacterium]|nr:MAG: hypothetical protein JSU63_18250 [Phycisphaerales bacterium]
MKALHDFLADNAQKLAREDDELLQGASRHALERYREERAELARLDRLERQGQLLPRAGVREGLARVAAMLKDVLGGVNRHHDQTEFRRAVSNCLSILNPNEHLLIIDKARSLILQRHMAL